jgi:hypothetical protein
MMTTKEHEIKEVHGPVILEAMSKSVEDLMDLWDFMELVQQSGSFALSSTIPSGRKRRGYPLDPDESKVHAGFDINGNKRRSVETCNHGNLS